MASTPLMLGPKPRKANMIRYLHVIRDARFEKRDPRFEMREPRFEMREPRLAMRDPRSELRDPSIDMGLLHRIHVERVRINANILVEISTRKSRDLGPLENCAFLENHLCTLS